jgi:hypothetical protein
MAEWWYYVVAVFAALLLVNGVPHFVQGISGKQFPSPFSGGPPNLDSAVHNVLWGAGNLIVGGVLFWLISGGLNLVLVVEMVVIGTAAAALLGFGFSHPERFGRKRG